MTRRLVLVNMSNWPNEEYEIDLEGKTATLAPGETLDLGAFVDEKQVMVTPTDNPEADKEYSPPRIKVDLPAERFIG